METMEQKRRRVRREFSEEFRADIVARCKVGDRSMTQVAKDFDLTPSSVRRWVAQAAVDAGERPGLTTEERQELSQLRRENKRLREDVEILCRATTFMWTARLLKG